jgi:imidazolonepropionase-like amidohydrolase
MCRSWLCAITLAVIATTTSSGRVAAHAGPSNSFVITHVRVFDGYRSHANKDVVVTDGLIRAVVDDSERWRRLPRVDGAGGTLLPGLIDAHTHTKDVSELEQALRFGVTTVLIRRRAQGRRFRLPQDRAERRACSRRHADAGSDDDGSAGPRGSCPRHAGGARQRSETPPVPSGCGGGAPAWPGPGPNAGQHRSLPGLTAATANVAAAFRLTDRGRIIAGARADLVLVRGDPTRDITSTRDILRVWRSGVECERRVESFSPQ